MSGQIALGRRWFAFRATELLRAGVGFVWSAVVGGRLVRFSGADLLHPDGARMDFRFHGLVPVAKATGEEVARSARGRLAAETVVWLPQALAPQLGAHWRALDGERAIVSLEVQGETVPIEVQVDESGALSEVRLERWDSSRDPPAYRPFGCAASDELVTPEGVRVAGCGFAGWDWGAPPAEQGVFFRFRIDGTRFLDGASAGPVASRPTRGRR
jgi:hypothetical protein